MSLVSITVAGPKLQLVMAYGTNESLGQKGCDCTAISSQKLQNHTSTSPSYRVLCSLVPIATDKEHGQSPTVRTRDYQCIESQEFK